MKKNFSVMSVDERKEYLKEHFMYEVRMLFFALQQNLILTNKILAGEVNLRMLNNMALEDFLLHAKILLEFFYDFKKSKASYICAWHFFNNLDEYKRILPDKTAAIKKVENRVNNEISHLGANRFNGTPTEKSWNTVPVLHDFMKLVKIFINKLPNEYYSNELRDY
jgi:hypothetical protein